MWDIRRIKSGRGPIGKKRARIGFVSVGSCENVETEKVRKTTSTPTKIRLDPKQVGKVQKICMKFGRIKRRKESWSAGPARFERQDGRGSVSWIMV